MTDTATDTDAADSLALSDRRGADYGARVLAVEPGGADFVPVAERHGRPSQLFWTWLSPNMEFATVFVGVLGVQVFGLTFTTAIVALVLGTAAGSLTHGLLSANGPSRGVPQMVASRIPFGWWGNVLPAGLNSVTAGIGWFAVNSVSGAFALNALLHWPKVICLSIVVVAQIAIAFFGHNLLQAFERWLFPVLGIAFLLAAIEIFTKVGPSRGGSAIGGSGGFLLTFGAAFGYAVGWNPFASDYTRYLPATVSKVRTGLFAGLGVFVSCAALEIVGAASASASATVAGGSPANPTVAFTSHLPTGIADFTLLAIAVGAVCANAMNVYSGAMSFLALGFNLPLRLRRAISALGFGLIGFVLALFGLHDAGTKYENFLLIIAYWIAPWLAVVLIDQLLRRGQQPAALLFDRHRNPFAGWIAIVVGMAVSIPLFSNQTEFVGVVAKHHPALGDITFEVGFAVSAIVYLLLRPFAESRSRAAA
ncbi:MAG TPA: cytosine permease [Frankiaceae bacterium]|nr:cytosine permease [Frankiaceae bacterium]